MIVLENEWSWRVLNTDWYDWIYVFKDYTALVEGVYGK